MAVDGEFVRELSQLLNKHSIDTKVEMPDFILADLLARNILALSYCLREAKGFDGLPPAAEP